MTSQMLVEQFRHDIGTVSSTVDEREIRQKSHDFHWYSPVLTPQLQNCMADVVVQPQSEEEIAAVVTAAVKHRIPLTVRGGGTGNYGQSVPLKGGVLLDMTGFNKVMAVEPGNIRVQGGAVIRQSARGGFGIGPAIDDVSIDHAIGHDRRLSRWRLCRHRLRPSWHHSRFRDDPVSQNHDHRRVPADPDALRRRRGVSFFTPGARPELYSRPSSSWFRQRNGSTASRRSRRMADVIAFGNAAFDSDLDIFLLSAVERRFAPYYKRLNKYFDGSRDAMFSMVKESDVDRYFALAATFDGQRSMAVNDTQSAAANLRRIHETAFNHTTLMALQVDRGWTYLQVVMPNPFEPKLVDRAEAPLRRRSSDASRIYQGEGPLPDRRAAAHSVHDGTAAERNHAVLRTGRLFINNPHIFKLEDGGRFDPDGRKMAFRNSVDPMGLLNPGKLRSVS